MTLELPRIAVAAVDIGALKTTGRVYPINGLRQAVVCDPDGSVDDGPASVWVVASYSRYREAWEAAAAIESFNNLGIDKIGE